MTRAQVLEGTWEDVRSRADSIVRQRDGRVWLILLTDATESEANTASDLTPAEKISLLDAVAALNEDRPALPSEALNRESLYAEE